MCQVFGEAPGVGAAALLPSPTREREAGDALPSADAAFWGIIGHLYAAARAELIRCGLGSSSAAVRSVQPPEHCELIGFCGSPHAVRHSITACRCSGLPCVTRPGFTFTHLVRCACRQFWQPNMLLTSQTGF